MSLRRFLLNKMIFQGYPYILYILSDHNSRYSVKSIDLVEVIGNTTVEYTS